jgi:glucose/arabinose dehydrogenase
MLHRRTVLTSGLAGLASSATLLAPDATAASAASAPTAGKVLAHDLVVPWGLAFLPNGDALVGERPSGRVHRVSRHGGSRHIGTVQAAVDFGEGGLLGIAVAPTFADDRWVYFYVTTSEDNRVIRKRYVGGELGRTHVLFSGIARTNGDGSSTHHGGRLAFGPSGHLFVSTGDGRLGRRAQNNRSPNGKILRLNPDGSVPTGNPIAGNPLWTKGHRNVEGLAWDGQGRMWATEFGEHTHDELNRIRPGRNYGWPVVEGRDGPGGYTDPFVTWTPTSSCSPSGLAIARGRAWVGALAGHCLFSVRLSGPHAGRKVKHFDNTFGRIRTVAKAPDGSLWITTSNRDGRGTPGAADDRVIRINL